MGSMTPNPAKPWIETPLAFSPALSKAAGCNIYLKLENLQPSGSFKSRGVGNMMFRALAAGPLSQPVHFFCSSGGNAGLACATTAAALGCKATIVVPTSTSALMVGKLRTRAAGVDVIQTGANWAEADGFLRRELLAQAPGGSRAVYVPPFDHPDIWAGAATLVDEVAEQMAEPAVPIDAIVCNVGGGGLLNGVLEGLEARRMDGVKVLAVETVGAASLHASVQAGQLVTLPAITSIATSLGATRVSEKTWEWAQRSGDRLTSSTVTDGEAALACVRFLDDEKVLVEVSCGATVATAYNGDLRRYLGKGDSDEVWKRKNVVLVVCGGSNVNMDMLIKYKETYGGK
ncbi:tryptophan synthase beta subunit-like PLP-dependent enzyme [Podospora appendiculata]|uniref:L-serine ammonia-lyase n=1 Tax=Podospora appendiculata TaxID=314037 RepID=A0AAE0X6Y8_9PEZI|nr:tryptophan synthase beta subunit-like PLP-dependent enzyme [Podospora appendiculata]